MSRPQIIVAGIVPASSHSIWVAQLRKQPHQGCCVLPGGPVEEYDISWEAALKRHLFSQFNIEIPNCYANLKLFDVVKSDMSNNYIIFGKVNFIEYGGGLSVKSDEYSAIIPLYNDESVGPIISSAHRNVITETFRLPNVLS